MENMIRNKDMLTKKHLLLLTLISKVKSAKTLYNIDQILSRLGYYMYNSLDLLKELQSFHLVEHDSHNETCKSYYKCTDIGAKYVDDNLELYYEELKEMVENKFLFIKIIPNEKNI